MSERGDGDMLVVSEAVCQQVIDQTVAFDAVEAVFAAMARGQAQNFPVVRQAIGCLLYTSPSPRDRTRSRMPSSA